MVSLRVIITAAPVEAGAYLALNLQTMPIYDR